MCIKNVIQNSAFVIVVSISNSLACSTWKIAVDAECLTVMIFNTDISAEYLIV